MPMNVGKTFLHHPENRGFRLRGEPSEIIGQLEVDFDFAALRSVYVPPNRRRQACFIQQRG